jgi:glycosyltransferase involved in cell wall biosynthesis
MGTEKPLVSVIVPFLNAERFIRETIESVFSQAFKEWELLLVDDGSTDDSTEIALQYEKENPGKVHYFEHDNHINLGLPASRNLGLRNSNGKYIALLDADDVWFPNKLEEQVSILESEPEAAMVYGISEYWYSWLGDTRDGRSDYKPGLGVKPNSIANPPRLLTLALKSEAPTPCPSDILVRRNILEDVGGFEEKFSGIYQLYEDQAFLSKIYVRYPVYVSDRCWDRYRQHPDSLVSGITKSGNKYRAGLFFLEWLEQYLFMRGIDDDILREALRDKKLRYGNAAWSMSHPFLSKLKRAGEIVPEALNKLVGNPPSYSFLKPVRSFIVTRLKNKEYIPPPGWVRFGDMRRLKPFSERWGRDRGLPIDRYFIEDFIGSNSGLIKGCVLEFGDDRYTQKFYNPAISVRDIINLNKEANPGTTIAADIVNAPQIPSDTYDCIICTQTLQFIYDHKKAVETLYRILAPGGFLLATFPGISPTSGTTWSRYWCWNFTVLSAENMFREFFPQENVEVKAYGNLICAAGFLYGLSAEELTQEELGYHDPRYEIVVTVKAVKP